jgi:hypothetical protein
MRRRSPASATSRPVVPWRALLLGVLGVLGLLAWPRAASANMARSSWQGELHGPLVAQEPTTVRVDAEELSFTVSEDLSSAAVVARYLMSNPGGGPTGSDVAEPARSSDVAFVFVHGERNWALGAPRPPTITIDGAAIEFRTVEEAALSEAQRRAWGAGPTQRLTWLVFRLDLPPGQARTVEVRYHHIAAQDLRTHVNPTYSYDYLLSPARSWAGFGALRLRVTLPDAAELLDSTVPLARDGADYRAELPGLPAGELTFSVSSTEGLWFGAHSRGAYFLTFGLALALGTLPFAALLGWRWRRNTPEASRGLLLLWTALLVGAVAVGLGWLAGEIFPRRAFGFGYESAFRLFGCVTLDIVISMIVARAVAGARTPSESPSPSASP